MFNLFSVVLVRNGGFALIVDMRRLYWPKVAAGPLLYINYFYLLKNQKRDFIGAYMRHSNRSKQKYLLSVTFCPQFLSLAPAYMG